MRMARSRASSGRASDGPRTRARSAPVGPKPPAPTGAPATGDGEDTGRVAQRRRTRKAIVAAAAELVAEGRTPSIMEIAAAADVSRRTIYMYFPTLEQLLVDAALLAITREAVEPALAAVDATEDVETRVETMARAVQRNFVATEREGRTLLRLTVDSGSTERTAGHPLRGYRRIEWIERALAPLRARVAPADFERLVSALAMVIGWEAVIVARDLRTLRYDDAADVSAWAARALVRAALDERQPARGKRTGGGRSRSKRGGTPGAATKRTR
jgi:AcrR family transcriptional regulator